jgi:hypothetical protein
MPFGNSFMATTECAHAFAKRKMDIQTYALRVIALKEGTPNTFIPLFPGKGPGVPAGDGGIAGITGSRNIVFLYQITHWLLFITKLAQMGGASYDIDQVSLTLLG